MTRLPCAGKAIAVYGPRVVSTRSTPALPKTSQTGTTPHTAAPRACPELVTVPPIRGRCGLRQSALRRLRTGDSPRISQISRIKTTSLCLSVSSVQSVVSSSSGLHCAVPERELSSTRSTPAPPTPPENWDAAALRRTGGCPGVVAVPRVRVRCGLRQSALRRLRTGAFTTDFTDFADGNDFCLFPSVSSVQSVVSSSSGLHCAIPERELSQLAAPPHCRKPRELGPGRTPPPCKPAPSLWPPRLFEAAAD